MLGFGLQLNKQRSFEASAPIDDIQNFVDRVQDDNGTFEALACLVNLYEFLKEN